MLAKHSYFINLIIPQKELMKRKISSKYLKIKGFVPWTHNTMFRFELMERIRYKEVLCFWIE